MGAAIGFDFNPVVDRLRLTTDTDQNLRINVATGATFTDGALVYGAGDANVGQDPNVVASAYTNNFPGATATSLRGIDSRLDILVIQNPANAGTLTTVGALGVNTGDNTSFDISSGGIAYAGMTLVGGTNTGFYTINLTTGSATFLAIIGGITTVGGESVRGIAVAPPIVQFARATSFVKEDRSPAVIGVIRTGDTSGVGTVNYVASAGTATVGTDFTAVTGSLTFSVGEKGKTFLLPIVDDQQAEADESVKLNLTTPTGGGGATLSQKNLADLIIADNDSRGRGRNDSFWAGYGDWDWAEEWWSRIRRSAK